MKNLPRLYLSLWHPNQLFRRRQILNFSESGLLILVLVSLVILLKNFQGTGDLHDAGVYFRSGLDVLKGDNPYPKSRWGTFGPVPFAITISLFPEYLQAIVIKLSSFLSLALVVRYLLPRMTNLQLILVLFFCSWISSFRELIATNQMSLIALGVFVIGTKVSKRNLGRIHLSGNKFIAAFFILVALELKPHLILALFIFWLIHNRDLPIMVLTIFLALLAHAVIDLSQGKILEIDFLKNLLGLGDKASSSALGDSLSFWPILNHYFHAPKVYFACALVLPLALACFGALLAYNHSWLNASFIAFLIPSTSIYFHFYDAIPICVVAIYALIKLRNIPLGTFTLAFLLIPKEFLINRNQLLVIVLTLMYSIYASQKAGVKAALKDFLLWISGITSALILHTFNSNLNLSAYLHQSLIVTETIVLATYVFLYAALVKKVFESRETMIQ